MENTNKDGYFTIVLPFPPSSEKIQIRVLQSGYLEAEKEIEVNISTLSFSAGTIILQQEEGSIIGTVISQGEKLIEGAEVSRGDKKTTTSQNGSFSLSGIMPGDWELIVKKLYFYDQKKMITVKGGKNDVGTITLQGFSGI